jgi:subtilase family protein
MYRIILRLTTIAAFIFSISLVGQFSVGSDSTKKQTRRQPTIDATYRSQSERHKVIVYAHHQELRDRILAEGGSLVEDYGGFSLLYAPRPAVDMLSAESASGSSVRDDMNVILLSAGGFDTTEGEPQYIGLLGDGHPDSERLHLVQMVGPVKQEWFDELQSIGEVVSYIPNNAYLVRLGAAGLERVNDIKLAGGYIQWSGDYKPAYKIAPQISMDSAQEVFATVQLVSSNHTDADIQAVALASSESITGEPVSFLSYTNVRVKASPAQLIEIARMSNVVWIEPFTVPQLFDERQGLIVAGGFVGNQLTRPGYLAWLKTKGITTTPDFLVDVADSGIDKGILDPEVLHKDFLNSAGLARVIYSRLESFGGIDGTTNDTGGHGTINAAIVGGYNTGAAFPNTDSEGYSFGLGVHPFVKLGVTKIFNPDFTNPNLTTMIDAMHRDGVRISSNSWGAYSNDYSTDSQLYDSLVRDARRGVAGNQEMTVIFASGNKGQNNLSTPGTAKNVITVGASENMRGGMDGCQIDSNGADDIGSIIEFSSGGRSTDGRIKPDIVAPGTHIQGAASQDQFYRGEGVCGPKNYPAGQSLYTWSSGTSHSTPAVAGAAAVVRQFFQQSVGHPPSPAMVKAFLTNSANYMAGNLAGGNLPGTSQGWGLVNLGRALDDSPRMMVDQDQVLSNTGQVITVRGRVSDPTKPFRITLAWTDAPGTPAAAAVVNNLDLQVDVGGRTYYGNRFNGETSVEGGPADNLNNVESVYAPSGVTGEFVVRVVAANITGDGLPGTGDTTDQDFALVIYNAKALGDGGGSIDAPPAVSLKYPVGGEKLMAGNLVRVQWDASDDKQIQSQRVDFSSDRGVTYNTIATLDGKARSFDWKIPALPTLQGRIKITALDGVNLPVSSESTANFEVSVGPPDTTPPQLAILAPTADSTVGGGLPFKIKWRETDNVGVVRRVIDLSVDNGNSFLPIVTIEAPSSGEQQEYEWQVPAALSTTKGKVRIKIFDGANNSVEVISTGKIDVWSLPIVTDVTYETRPNGNGQLEVFGRNFRMGETQVYVDGKKMKNIEFNDKCDGADGTCKKVSVNDKKIHKYVKEGEVVVVTIRVTRTNQISPEFRFKRKKPKA